MKTSFQTDVKAKLQFGDTTFKNFICQGDQLGIIDFEELGTSTIPLDLLCLEYWLGRASQSWKYWDCSELTNLISPTTINWEIKLLYAIQLAANRCMVARNQSLSKSQTQAGLRLGLKLLRQAIQRIH